VAKKGVSIGVSLLASLEGVKKARGEGEVGEQKKQKKEREGGIFNWREKKNRSFIIKSEVDTDKKRTRGSKQNRQQRIGAAKKSEGGGRSLLEKFFFQPQTKGGSIRKTT